MAYIGNSPENIQRGRRAVYEFTATASQTVFSGADDNGVTLDLQESVENDVYLNGSRLVFSDDYTIAGEVLTLTSAAAAGDILVIVTQDDIANVASYTKAEADARYINYDGDIVNGNIQVVGTVTADGLTVGDGHTIGNDGGDNLKIASSNAEGIIIDSNQYLALYGGNTQRAVVAANGGISFYEDTGTTPKFYWDAAAQSVTVTALDNVTTTYPINVANSAGSLTTGYGAYGIAMPAGSAYTMDISGDLILDTGGKVGIGTTSPVYQLHVNSGATNVVADFESTDGIAAIRLRDSSGNVELSASGNDFRVQPAGGTVGFIVKNNGNVGIGTSSPTSTLEVRGDVRIGALTSDNSDLILKANTGPAISVGGSTEAAIITTAGVAGGAFHVGIEIPSNDSNDGFYIATDSDNDGVVDTLAMKINAAGNVGIGTSSPSEKLQVEGSVKASDYYIDEISMLEQLISSWQPLVWYDIDDDDYVDGSNFVYSKGTLNYRLAPAGSGFTYHTMNGRRFWSGSNTGETFSDSRYETTLNTPIGYRGTFFFVSAYSSNIVRQGLTGSYYFDCNSPSRTSVSLDSFGDNIEEGELSYYSGSAFGYNDGTSTVGGILGDSNTDTTMTIHAVIASNQNYTGLRNNHISMATLTRGNLTTNLGNNGVAGGTLSGTQLVWGNRHSYNRSNIDRRYAEFMYFKDDNLTVNQMGILQKYFRLKYAGTQYPR